MNYFLKMPIFKSVFSGDKSKEWHTVNGNLMLNFLGMHLFRVIAAKVLRSFVVRRMSLTGEMAAYRDQLEDTGLLVIENFLPKEEFQLFKSVVKAEYGNGERGRFTEGDTVDDRVLLGSLTEATEKLGLDQRLVEVVSSATSTEREDWNAMVTTLKYRFHDDGEAHPDPQMTCHVDSFHDTFKFWFFTTPVSPDEGEFHYSPRTHRLTPRRVLWEYLKSLFAPFQEDKHGSFRVFSGDLVYPNLDFEALSVAENTLVVANTFGFHKRGAARQKCIRQAFFGYHRTSPFRLS